MGQTLYLDTANWYDLVEDKVSFRYLEPAISSGRIIPVLSCIHLLEFGLRTQPYRAQVTGFIDKVAALGGLLWIRDERTVARAELKKAFMEWMGLCAPPIEVFCARFADAYGLSNPSSEMVDAEMISVSKIVERLCDLPRYHSSFVTQKGTRTSKGISGLRDAYQENGRLPAPKAIDSVKNFLVDMPTVIHTSAGIEVEVTAGMRAEFLNALTWEKIRSTWLRVSAMVGWSMTSGGDSPSDVEDLFHLVGVAYCDKAFADKRTLDALSKGKAYKLPALNSEFVSWLEELHEEKEIAR
jgi:hypothetical protein